MRRMIALFGVVSAALLVQPAAVIRADTQSVLITHIQTTGPGGASEEFIKLTNVSADAIAMDNWKLEYFPASTQVFGTPTRTIPLSGVLEAGSEYVAASTGYLSGVANVHFSATLSKTGGHVRLTRPAQSDPNQRETVDVVGWGTATIPEGAAAPTPPDGGYIERKTDAAQQYVDTNNNATDFMIPGEPAEPAANQQLEDNSQRLSSDETIAPASTSYVPIDVRITELLPNPAPPATDSADEYIELYNAGNSTADLTGFVLQTGTTYSKKFTFSGHSIAPGSYGVFKISETKLTLSNTSGRARLLTPDQQVISETAAYESAKDGYGWALFDDGWGWTTQPTPGAPNILSEPQQSSRSSATSNKPSSTKKSSSSTTKKSASSPKTLGARSSSSGNDQEQTAEAEASAAEEPSPINALIIAGVGLAALVYAGYEYRHDVANKIYQFRANRTARRAARQNVAGR